jgi:hypothetical protein
VAASGLALGVGLGMLVATFFAAAAWRHGAPPGAVQQQAWLALAGAVLRQALLPLWGGALVTWLAVVRLAPASDVSWRTVAPGVTALALLWFVPVGLWSFDAWTPSDAGDAVGTALLCGGGVAAALLLPRLLFRPLAPGAFAPDAPARGPAR